MKFITLHFRYYMNYTSAESQAFEITEANREAGVVTLRGQVDRETSQSVTLVIRAEDSADPPLTG